MTFVTRLDGLVSFELSQGDFNKSAQRWTAEFLTETFKVLEYFLFNFEAERG